MPSRFSPLVRPALGLFAVATALSLANFSSAQDDQLGDIMSVETPYNKARTSLRNILSGVEPFSATNQKQAADIDLGAKYMTYRLTWAQYNAPKDEKEIG